MSNRGYAFLFVGLVMAITLVVGCTTQYPSPGAPAPAATAQPAAPQQPVSTQQPGNPQQTTAPSAPVSGGIDTTITVMNNNYACMDVQKGLGVDYLYPAQKFAVTVSPPPGSNVNVNALFLDTGDKAKMLAVPPKYDNVNKVWVYDGLVPLLQFNDVATPQQKTVTIKRQGQFYLCIDDRKETGGGDASYNVPVKFTPA